MANQTQLNIFYDIVYSSDDGGYYYQVFTREGGDLYTSDTFTTQQKTEQDLRKRYPAAQKCGDFTEIDEEI